MKLKSSPYFLLGGQGLQLLIALIYSKVFTTFLMVGTEMGVFMIFLVAFG